MKSKQSKEIFYNSEAALLVELLLAILLLVIILVGYLQLYIYCFVLAETTGNVTFATSEAETKLEEIRNHDFDNIVSDYILGGNPGNTFALQQLTGMGVIYIDSSNPELLEIETVVSWQEKANRIIGEDKNLDGDLDVGEDVNGNGKLDSPVSLITLIAKR